jgi:Putative Actinobacterial Holin-X, holin superfamily III
MIGAAGVAGLLGGAALTAAAVLLLARRLPAWAAALVVGAGVSTAGAVLAKRGVGKVREASALPRETIRETKETLDGSGPDTTP